MNLIRFIVLALVFWLVYRLIQRMLAKPVKGPSRGPKLVTDMVRCAHCGIHIPGNEALPRDGLFYCNEEHRAAGPSHE